MTAAGVWDGVWVRGCVGGLVWESMHLFCQLHGQHAGTVCVMS